MLLGAITFAISPLLIAGFVEPSTDPAGSGSVRRSVAEVGGGEGICLPFLSFVICGQFHWLS